MTTYYYLKQSPRWKTQKQSFVWRFFPMGLVIVGFTFLVNVAAPIIFYELKSVQLQPPLVSPIVLGEVLREIDYGNPRHWFSVVSQLPPRPSKITHYSLSVPKLKIKEATVQIGGKDLMVGLIHYPGTALPGQFGNTVIFGHSVLPQFFSPGNYKTIFSTLPTLKEKDEVLVNFDGVLYRYQVIQLVETTPEDVTILEQRYNDSYLSLITCVPPGTYLKRLVVKTKLVSI